MATEPAAWRGAWGPNKARVTTADTRPWRPAGVARWAKFKTARNTHGRAKPKTTDPATAAGSQPVARRRVPAAKLGVPKTARRLSPMRPIRRLLVRLATMEPAPNPALSTPRKLGGWPRARTRL